MRKVSCGLAIALVMIYTRHSTFLSENECLSFMHQIGIELKFEMEIEVSPETDLMHQMMMTIQSSLELIFLTFSTGFLYRLQTHTRLNESTMRSAYILT